MRLPEDDGGWTAHRRRAWNEQENGRDDPYYTSTSEYSPEKPRSRKARGKRRADVQLPRLRRRGLKAVVHQASTSLASSPLPQLQARNNGHESQEDPSNGSEAAEPVVHESDVQSEMEPDGVKETSRVLKSTQITQTGALQHRKTSTLQATKAPDAKGRGEIDVLQAMQRVMLKVASQAEGVSEETLLAKQQAEQISDEETPSMWRESAESAVDGEDVGSGEENEDSLFTSAFHPEPETEMSAFVEDDELEDADAEGDDYEADNSSDGESLDENFQVDDVGNIGEEDGIEHSVKGTSQDVGTEDADIEDADIEDADIEDADIEDADIEDADTDDTDTENADTEDADIEDDDLEDSDMDDTDTKDDNETAIASPKVKTLPVHPFFKNVPQSRIRKPDHTSPTGTSGRDAAGDSTTTLSTSGIEASRKARHEVYLQLGLYGLASHTLKEETETCKTLNGLKVHELRRRGYEVLVSAHPDVIKASLRMKGGWARMKLMNAELRSALDLLWAKAHSKKHPCIYANEIADKYGLSPTPNEIKEVIIRMRKYYLGEDEQLCHDIDSYKPPLPPRRTTRDGKPYRKYLRNHKAELVEDRIKKALEFCDNLERRLNALPPNMMDLPLEIPLIEIGYTWNIPARLGQHRDHVNSNHLMNVFESIINMLFPGKFQLHQFVLHYLVDGLHACPAEILFTRLNDGYIEGGGGFSHYFSGLSVHSAYNAGQSLYDAAYTWASTAFPKSIKETHQQQAAFGFFDSVDEKNRVHRLRGEVKALKEKMAKTRTKVTHWQTNHDQSDKLDGSLKQLRETKSAMEAEVTTAKNDEIEEMLRVAGARSVVQGLLSEFGGDKR